MTIDGDSRPMLYQHPPARVVYRQVRILDNSSLQFGVGIDPEVWSQDAGDGIEFQVWVQDESNLPVKVYGQVLSPKHNPQHRRWVGAEVDLNAFGGQTVEIHFVTLPGLAGDARYDWGG